MERFFLCRGVSGRFLEGMGIIFCLFVLVGWASNNYETGLFSWAGCWYGWQEGDRHGLCGRLPSVWSRYLAAWESTWFPGRTEQHADYLVITSLQNESKRGCVAEPFNPCYALKQNRPIKQS